MELFNGKCELNFNKKIIVVTGGCSGIGEEVVKRIAEYGGIVVALGRSPDKFHYLNSINNKSAGEIIPLKCDVSNYDNVEQVFNEIEKNFGSIFGLVNNAGVNPSRNNILNTSLKDWEETIKINLTGAFNCSKFAIKQMDQKSIGSIVNISSIAGLHGLQNRVAYSSSKAGLIGLTKSLAIDHARNNIRVNCICPGYVKTNLVSEYIKNLNESEYKLLINSHPIGRLGSVEDITNAILFLLSEKSSWITGEVLSVDGGYGLGKPVYEKEK